MFKYICMLIYIVFVLVIGLQSRKATTEGDEGYLLGGRSIGPVITAFSFAATYISGVAIVNAGKFGWEHGIGAIYNAWGNVLLSIMFMWLFLGRKTRVMSEKLGVQTLPDFLKQRFDTDYFKMVGGLVIFIFLVPYTATVFTCLSYLFESVFKVPYVPSLVLMSVLAAFYLAIGGYKAAAQIDGIQGGIMLIGGLVIFYFTIKAPEVGGLMEGVRRLSEINPDFTSWTLGGNLPMWSALIPMILLTSLAPNGLPHMVQKFFALKDPKTIVIGGVTCTILGFLIITSLHVPGFFAHLFFDEIPLDSMTGQPNIDILLPQILAKILPEWALALVLLLVLAASMSTMAGLVLASSAALGMDLIKGYIKKDMTTSQVTMLLRILSVVFVLAALVIALLRPAAVMTLMGLSWGAVSGFFISAYIYGILWKGTTKAAAITGSVVGFCLAVGLPLFFSVKTPVACTAAMLIPMIIVPIISLFTKKMDPDFLEYVYSEDMSVTGSFNAGDKAPA